MFDPQPYRALFPVTERYVYLNHAAITPPSRSVLDAVNEYMTDMSLHGSVRDTHWFEQFDAAHAVMARLIGAAPNEVAFVKSVSDGLNLIALGFDWRAGDNVVGVAGEFPSNVYPWLNLARFGVEARLVPQVDNRVLIEDLVAAMDSRTRLLAISFVEYNTGFRNDLAAIGRLCRERGIYFVVDAIQGLGALPLDVEAMNIDVLAAAAHKWLLGPLGTAILYVRQAVLDRGELHTANFSWLSVTNPFDLSIRPQDVFTDARRFDAGGGPFMLAHALAAVQLMVEEAGREAVATHILTLTGQLIAGLEEHGYMINTPHAHDGERSGIVAFTPKDGDAASTVARLQERGIIVAARGGVRVSPHLYNTHDEIERLLAEL